MKRKVIAIALACCFLSPAFILAEGQSEGTQQAEDEGSQEKVTITVWDQYKPLKDVHDAVMDRIEEQRPNVEFQHEIYNPADMPEALQLAYKSDQLPDITTNQTGGIPARRLIEQGWFLPVSDYVDIRDKEFIARNLFEGRTVFDGDVYSVPIFNRRWSFNTWYNQNLMQEAGVNAENLRTYSEFIDASRKISEDTEGDNSGMVLPIKFTARMTEMINDWAEAAGAPGQIDWRTGEYQYDTQPYVEVMNFILDLQDSNSLYPGSASIDARNARARWAGGNIGMFPDGPWNPGVLQGSYEQALDFTGVSWLPVPDRSGPNIGSIYVPPPDASFFLTNDSDNPEIAAEFFLGLTTDEYYTGLAQGMDQPPLKMSAIEEVDVHDSYKDAIAQYRENVLVQPVPEAANPNVAQVVGEMRDIHPNLGEIAQGLFSGAITDVQGALEEYNRKMTEERQRAINKLQDEGVDVSIDDWVFPNWDPTENFTPSMYE